MLPNSSKTNAYLKYSGLAFQLFGTLAVGALLGKWLDHKFNLNKPWCTVIIEGLLFVALMFWIYFDLNKSKK